MIEQFLKAGERFTRILEQQQRLNALASVDNAESIAERLLSLDHDRCGVRNEIDGMAGRVITEVLARGGDAMAVTRAVTAAWHYRSRWHDVWFETRSHLSAMLLQPQETTHTTRHDTKDDTPKKQRKIRRMNTKAADCARLYRADKGKTPLKTIVEDYAAKHGVKESSIMRILSDNPDQWKDDTDTTI